MPLLVLHNRNEMILSNTHWMDTVRERGREREGDIGRWLAWLGWGREGGEGLTLQHT